MRARIVILSMLFVVFFFQGHAQPERPIRVSLVALVANPEGFDGRLVAVTGYLRLDEEEDILYLTEMDYLHGLTKNGVWVERTKEMERDIEKLDSNYVVIVGIVSAKHLGHMAASSGGIVRIRSCTFWSDPKYPVMRRLEDERKKIPR